MGMTLRTLAPGLLGATTWLPSSLSLIRAAFRYLNHLGIRTAERPSIRTPEDSGTRAGGRWAFGHFGSQRNVFFAGGPSPGITYIYVHLYRCDWHSVISFADSAIRPIAIRICNNLRLGGQSRCSGSLYRRKRRDGPVDACLHALSSKEFPFCS